MTRAYRINDEIEITPLRHGEAAINGIPLDVNEIRRAIEVLTSIRDAYQKIVDREHGFDA